MPELSSDVNEARPSGCSSMVERQPSKLLTGVRFPSPAPIAAIPSGGVEAIDVVWSTAGLVASVALPVGWQNLGKRSSLASFFIGAAPLIGTELWWAMATDSSRWSRLTVAGGVGAFCGAVILMGATELFHSMSNNPRFRFSTDKRPVANDQPASPNVTGSGTTVVSIGQSGGVTTGTYVNQAVMPELRVIGRSGQRNSDGTYTTTVDVLVVASVTPANVNIQMQAADLLDVRIIPPARNGFATIRLADVVKTRSSYSANILNPYGQYAFLIRTANETPINLSSHF